jgi:hypothetical protein
MGAHALGFVGYVSSTNFGFLPCNITLNLHEALSVRNMHHTSIMKGGINYRFY